MNEDLLKRTLNDLLVRPAETEVFELKEAKKNYDFTKIGKYFSALSNEANLKRRDYAWLVFGVKDNDHSIVGSSFRLNRADLDCLKGEIAKKTTNRITFIEIHELQLPGGRVVMFQIPSAPKGIPIAFDGHYYARDGEELGPLNLEELERIRIPEDWSVCFAEGATVADLDPKAIIVARVNYKNKFPEKAADVDNWDDLTFLNKAKITIKGKITNTTILLLGREESEHFINPAEAKIRWVLKNSDGSDKDYMIATCPFILAIGDIYSKIRISTYRYIQDGSLFPEQVNQYEPYIIREALNNCIAHQDYTKHGRINVIELNDHLIFTNVGSFIPGSVERVVIDNAPEEHYRNPFLATAMFNLNMVDTAGGGIRKMFDEQRQKFFPFPEYDLSDGKVKVTITGKVLDMDYARVLLRHPNLTLEEIIMLDKVQKRKWISADEIAHLKSKLLIEGRKPNFYISLSLAQKTGQKATYTKQRGLNKKYYLDLIMIALNEHGALERKEIDELLHNKLPDSMTPQQKKYKVSNLLTELRLAGGIENLGSDRSPKWTLKKS